MEFLVICDSKLKIILTDADIKEYNIDAVGSDCTDPLCRRVVWKLLDRAKKEVGFDPQGDKVLVQFYPMKPSGCEVFVTKLGILSATSAKIVSESKSVALLSRERIVYSFDGLDHLISAARAIKGTSKVIPRSEAWLGEGGMYFLTVEEYGKGESSEFPSILEYGRSLPPEFFVYISEHTEKLTDGNAIEELSSL